MRFVPDGAEHIPSALSDSETETLRRLADAHLQGRSGVRVSASVALSPLLATKDPIGGVAAKALGSAARPVRTLLFDKTTKNNWTVAWHQDRTIAVRERRDVPGFGPWSMKAGVVHVEPPYALFQNMVTLRVHLDVCDAENAPLMIAPGSHKLGRIPATEAATVAQKLGTHVCIADAGDIWLYAAGIIHASERAHRPRRRRVLQIDYANVDLPGGLAWQGI